MLRFIIYFLWILIGGILKITSQNDTILVQNVNIIPMDRDVVLKNYNVLIFGEKIIEIQPYSKLPVKRHYFIVNASDKYLMPGLAEMHFHHQTDIENEFKLLLANGITTVRNMAEEKGKDQIKIKQLAKEKALAPLYFTTGPYLMRNNLKTIDTVIAVVKRHKERGYDFLKIADNLPKNIYIKLLEETYKNNIPIVGHGQRELPLEYTLRMKSIAHIEEFMNIFSMEDRKNNEFLKEKAIQIKNSGIYVSPTLGIFEMISRYADDKKHRQLINSEELKFLSKDYRDYWKSDSVHYRKHEWFTSEKSLLRLKKELNWQQNFTKILFDANVPLLSSSDTYGLFLPGFSLHKELELINSSGLSNYETLKTATLVPARYLNTISQEGSINEGKRANLVLLDKNPLEDIQNTKSISGLFVKGKWLDKKALKQLLDEVEMSYKEKPSN